MHCSSISSIAWSLQCPGHCQSAPVLKMELCGTGRRLTERMWASGIGAVTASLLMRRARGKREDSTKTRTIVSRKKVLMTLGLEVASLRPKVSGAMSLGSTLGFGTCCLKGEASEEQVYQGLKIGYRFIDTASHYDNEGSVAGAIRRAAVPREELFLVTKIWKRLETDYVDLLLIHFPGTNDAIQSPGTNRKRREDTWKQLETAKLNGQAKSIGVANFTRRHLKEILSSCKEPPEVMQTEVHPYFQQSELLELCRQKNLQIQAFSPFAHGELGLLDDRLLKEIAAKHQRTVPQVVLRWLLQQGITPIAFSRSTQNMRENWAAVQEDWQLSPRELDRISLLDRGQEIEFKEELQWCHWKPVKKQTAAALQFPMLLPEKLHENQGAAPSCKMNPFAGYISETLEATRCVAGAFGHAFLAVAGRAF
eukprot:symbB.v1.2.040270.t1/scaffold7114.1/size13255/1